MNRDEVNTLSSEYAYPVVQGSLQLPKQNDALGKRQ